MLSGLLPGVVFGTGTAAFVLLVVVRFVLGVTIAGVYPISALTVAKWQPVTQRAFSYSFIVAGVFIGSAVTPPIVVWLMVTLGWRESFYLVSVFGIAAALTWKFYGANHPREHPDVSPGELALITEGREPAVGPPPVGAVWWTLKNPSVLFLSASYFLAGYVLYTFIFWFFTYLVEERQFTLLEGGVYASLPFIAAGILSPVGGAICDWSTMRFGQRWGRRLTAFTGPILAGALLFWGARTENVILAICALALSFGFQAFAEAAYWSTTMDISGRMTGAATGILTTMEKEYFEDYTVGETLVSPARTVTESDINAFAMLTGDWHPLHTDVTYAESSVFGERIAHGMLTLILGSTLVLRLGPHVYLPKSFIAFYGIDRVRFTAPVKIGDTIHAVNRVKDLALKDEERGILHYDGTVLNQRDETVLVWEVRMLVGCRPGQTGREKQSAVEVDSRS